MCDDNSNTNCIIVKGDERRRSKKIFHGSSKMYVLVSYVAIIYFLLSIMKS